MPEMVPTSGKVPHRRHLIRQQRRRFKRLTDNLLSSLYTSFNPADGNHLAQIVRMDIHALAKPGAIGSEIFALISLLVISIVVLLILRHYLPLRTTPGYLLVPVFLALQLPASIVLLVPIDLASSVGTDDGTRGIWLPQRLLLVSWRITYWLTFALTW
jgi:hypothetical protein